MTPEVAAGLYAEVRTLVDDHSAHQLDYVPTEAHIFSLISFLTVF